MNSFKKIKTGIALLYVALGFFGITSCMAQSFDAIINLGGDCQVAYQMHVAGLRSYALPFDTLVTSYETLEEMLQHTFDGFMEPHNFELAVDEKGIQYILDKKYGARLLHDFKVEKDFLKEYDTVAAKYVRRIERLISLIRDSEYPLFIRKIITKDQAEKLTKVLLKMRSDKPFLLVALDGAEDIKSDWQIPLVRNFYLRQRQPYSWKGDPEAWKEIFNELKLPVSQSTESVPSKSDATKDTVTSA